MKRHLLSLVLFPALALGIPGWLLAQHHSTGPNRGGPPGGVYPAGGMHPPGNGHPIIKPVGNTVVRTTNTNVNWRTINGRPYNQAGWVTSWNKGIYRGYRRGWYDGWYPWISGYWTWPGTYPLGRGWSGTVVGTVGWTNPYLPTSTTAPEEPATASASYDYSQPLPPVAADNTPADSAPGDQVTSSAPPVPAVPADVLKDFDTARETFKQGDYDKALVLSGKAAAKLPGDASLHEFRALTLFAKKNYREAAAALYAVLSAGPGWDWSTVWALYPNAKTYTEQLRALEAYSKANPDDAASHFLLGYHYLMTDHSDSAVRQLEQAAKLNPKDEVSTVLAKGLKKSGS
jgi:hypothetical protein